ncbi:MAG: hypothetical protein IB618_03390 [Candidatus Pacearchaeota archaeon]|nr:MAG: hypothetical protein IB618_03390 [Candidatus Pacearchaeota archaeon]
MEKDLIKEITIIVLASLFLGFVLALNVSLPMISFEPDDFFIYFLLSLAILGIFVLAQKATADYLDCKIRIKLLSFRKYWFRPLREGAKAEFPFEFPAWLALPLILVIITNGFFKWLAILNFDIEPKPSRVRRRWEELTEADIGKIALSGPIAVLILGLIIRVAGYNEFAMICAWLAFLTLIPIGLGFKILNSTRVTWFFAFIFSLFILLLMNLTNTFATIIIALLLAAIITIAYYTLYEK